MSSYFSSLYIFHQRSQKLTHIKKNAIFYTAVARNYSLGPITRWLDHTLVNNQSNQRTRTPFTILARTHSFINFFSFNSDIVLVCSVLLRTRSMIANGKSMSDESHAFPLERLALCWLGLSLEWEECPEKNSRNQLTKSVHHDYDINVKLVDEIFAHKCIDCCSGISGHTAYWVITKKKYVYALGKLNGLYRSHKTTGHSWIVWELQWTSGAYILISQIFGCNFNTAIYYAILQNAFIQFLIVDAVKRRKIFN